MTFRYARHTTNLTVIEKFYTGVVGLERLGGFEDHDDYDGLFLGLTGQDWHLEFTVSKEIPDHKFDGDDALVFYVYSEAEMRAIKKRIIARGINIEPPLNPYWQKNGCQIEDPDGCKIIFSIRHHELLSKDPLTDLVRRQSITNWSGLLEWICKLPYGRNQNREDLSLVLIERKGSCSSKHALLKKLADLNGIKQVQLILGIYKMDHINTPGIKSVITDSGLDYIPEAHCYLRLNGQPYDLTTKHSDIERIQNDILEEIEIEPGQVNQYKIAFHKAFICKWIATNNIELNPEKVWEIREHCIAKLSGD